MSDANTFRNRIVAVWAEDPAKGGMLQDVSIRSIGDRAFLVGQLTGDGTSYDPRDGLTMWFPVENIVMLTEYPNLEKAREFYEWRARIAQTGKPSGDA